MNVLISRIRMQNLREVFSLLWFSAETGRIKVWRSRGDEREEEGVMEGRKGEEGIMEWRHLEIRGDGGKKGGRRSWWSEERGEIVVMEGRKRGVWGWWRGEKGEEGGDGGKIGVEGLEEGEGWIWEVKGIE